MDASSAKSLHSCRRAAKRFGENTLVGILRTHLFGIPRSKARKSTGRPSSRPRVELLEGREAPASGLTATLAGAGVLTVTGTDQADVITVRQVNNRLYVNGISGSYAVSQVKQIVVNAGGGNDTINLNSGATRGQQAIVRPATLNNEPINH